jgi:hypothetical protein
MALFAHALVVEQPLHRFNRDDRTHIGRQPVGIANAELGRGALQHRQDSVGDVLLQAEHAQRRTALTGRIEGRGHGILHQLLRQR